MTLTSAISFFGSIFPNKNFLAAVLIYNCSLYRDAFYCWLPDFYTVIIGQEQNVV